MKDIIRLLLLLIVIATLHAMRTNHLPAINVFSKKNTVKLDQVREIPMLVSTAAYSTAP